MTDLWFPLSWGKMDFWNISKITNIFVYYIGTHLICQCDIVVYFFFHLKIKLNNETFKENNNENKLKFVILSMYYELF